VIVGAARAAGEFRGEAYVYDGTTGDLLHTLTGNAGARFGAPYRAGGCERRQSRRFRRRCVGESRAYSRRQRGGCTRPPAGCSIAFGRVISRLPDVNGDGRDDVVVAPWVGSNQVPYVFSGATGELLATLGGYSYQGGQSWPACRCQR
jgi:hypothetical protein